MHATFQPAQLTQSRRSKCNLSCYYCQARFVSILLNALCMLECFWVRLSQGTTRCLS